MGEREIFSFTDSVTGAYCSMIENPSRREYAVSYAIPEGMGLKPAVIQSCPIGDYDLAFSMYRTAMNTVLDGIKEWDND